MLLQRLFGVFLVLQQRLKQKEIIISKKNTSQNVYKTVKQYKQICNAQFGRDSTDTFMTKLHYNGSCQKVSDVISNKIIAKGTIAPAVADYCGPKKWTF